MPWPASTRCSRSWIAMRRANFSSPRSAGSGGREIPRRGSRNGVRTSSGPGGEVWGTRKGDFSEDGAGVKHALARLDAVLALVDRDAACELFFAEERRFWETRNRAARIQKRRQDQLGLGWGNHDHHTFRS